MATISCAQFTQLLVDEQPKYDKRILRDITPMDGWIGHYASGMFPAFSGTSLYQDRFNSVYPNTTKPWNTVSYASCVGAPCNPQYNSIGWGSERLQYSLMQQSWQTPPLCFDQELHVTHAREQFSQIIGDILRPATSAIASMFLRKQALFWSSKKWIASSLFGQETAGEFAYIWQNDANGNEVYLLTSAMPTSKLTPQMLANRVNPLIGVGYMGASPFKDGEMPPFIELVTGLETCWELDHLGGQQGIGGTPSIAGNWRFEQWSAANKYWRYGFTGSIGNYATRVDPFEMRFNFLGASGNATYPFKFQLVLPYENVVSSGAGGAAGLKRTWNQAFSNACYSMSFISHKQALEILTQEMAKINPEMPYVTQNYGGKWRAVLPNVCPQDDGTVTALDNRLGNIVQFLARFQLAARPGHTEWLESIFHKREPQCIIEVDTCKTCDHPTQSYDSANSPCE